MEIFNTPTNTIVPTVTAAIDDIGHKFSPFVTRLESRDKFLRYLHMFRGIISVLWQGSVHLRHLTGTHSTIPELSQYCDLLSEEWPRLEESIFADAASRGLERKHFLLPNTHSQQPYFGCDFEPPARVSIARMLSGQFHIQDDPSIFLIRQLAMRILFAAFVQNVPQTVESEFIKIIRSTKLSHEWVAVPELQLAADLHVGSFDAQSHHFGYQILREIALMKDLFELVLRQLQDPLPIGNSM